MNDTTIGLPVTRRALKDDLPDVYPPGRPCSEPGCTAYLCRYNPGERCWCHARKLEDDEHPRDFAEALVGLMEEVA